MKFLLLMVCLSSMTRWTEGLQNLLKSVGLPTITTTAIIGGGGGTSIRNIEDELITTIQELGIENRLFNSNKINTLVSQLETSGKSIPRPAISKEIYGRWRLLHTTNTNTASPIQRKVVDTSKFPIYQDIIVNNQTNQLIISQVVKFNNNQQSELKLDAIASTSTYPLPELTERKSDGKILGLNILGVSSVGKEAQENLNKPDSRINFVFDEGIFHFNNKIRIPYPVPFRLPILRDTVKGWIDIIWLSDRLRISKGNKGTTFILLKEENE